jgi:hypothetical protein
VHPRVLGAIHWGWPLVLNLGAVRHLYRLQRKPQLAQAEGGESLNSAARKLR